MSLPGNKLSKPHKYIKCFYIKPANLVNIRFIKTYGTHIIVEMGIGGQDVICVKQSHSSTVSTADLKLHLEDLGDFLFSDGKNHSPIHRKTKDGKSKVQNISVFSLCSHILYHNLANLINFDYRCLMFLSG